MKRVVLSVAICLLAASNLPAAKPLPDLKIPEGLGVNIHFRHDPVDLDMIADAGFTFIRMDFTWAAVERAKGVYDFEKTGYDALTAGCTRRGIRLLYILDYSNRLYESDRSVRTQTGRDAYTRFAAAAAKRYAGKGILWEIWNEPNIKQFWTPQPSVDDYCKLVGQAAPAIRESDPSGLVVAGATSRIPFDWFEACFKKGLLEHVDVLSVHPYRSQPPETVMPDYKRLRQLIDKYAPQGKNIPIISGEWGYSNVNWDKNRLSGETQANYLVREFLINYYCKIPVSIWYDWKNDGTNPKEREHNFGTVTHELQPKPAYEAAKVLTSTLEGYSVSKRLDLESHEDYALLLHKDRAKALAVWTTAEDHKVNIPLEPGEGTLLNMLGKKKQIAWEDNGPKLNISQSPQYLLITPKVQFEKADGRIDVTIGGEPFTSYIYKISPDKPLAADNVLLTKPVLYPLRTPDGVTVTRGWPFEDIQGERKDHPHHIGLYFTYDQINGNPFWNNSRNPLPAVKHVKTIEMAGGEGSGTLVTEMHWIGKDNKPLLREIRKTVFTAAGDYIAMNFNIEFKAIADKVEFGDTKEGMFAIRLAQWLTENTDSKYTRGTGSYLSSNGDKREKGVWGKRAKWVRIQGQKDDKTAGIAILNHPTSTNYPTYWHARGYGAFSANPLGQYKFQQSKGVDNPKHFGLELKKGQTASFKFRVIIYDGDWPAEKIEKQWKDYAK